MKSGTLTTLVLILTCTAGAALVLLGIEPSERRTPRKGSLARRLIVTKSSHRGAVLAAGATLVLTFLGTGSLPLGIVGAGFCTAVVIYSRRSKLSSLKRQLLHGWPPVLDEIRIRVSSLGESIPQAMFEAAKGFESQVSEVFEANLVSWNLTGDFGLVTHMIREDLKDSNSDAVLQTLLLCHEMPSNTTETRLERLRQDRAWDLETSKEIEAKLAGAYFARRFVLIVPIGMALAGAEIGGGRSSFTTTIGVSLSIVALAILLLCWIWSSRLLGMPELTRTTGVAETSNSSLRRQNLSGGGPID